MLRNRSRNSSAAVAVAVDVDVVADDPDHAMDHFTAGLRRVLSVPKDVIDREMAKKKRARKRRLKR